MKLGISPRRLSGWEPVAVTRYEYDEAGRLAGSWVEREPEFSRADVEALIAFIEKGRVGSHGYPMSEATAREGDPSNHDREWDWFVDLPEVDFAQRALDQARESYKQMYPDADMGARLFRVEKRYRGDAISASS